MPLYKIFAGLGGGFGGAKELYTEECESIEIAHDIAYEEALQCYESYEGMHGLAGWAEAMDEAKLYCERNEDETDEEYEQALEDYADEIYIEYRESWIDYWAESVED